MRKRIAGWFIRTGQRIYRPTVEEMAAEVKQIVFADGSSCPLKPAMTVNNYGMDPAAASAAVERQWRRRDLGRGRR
ncbi:hypothetical protein [Nocardia abscessus]|uniref:hypothetical protein n=1 Tax=Nocardia abscessus TaxID=120957 RepID=UPI0002F654E5|nr:hypothetical protein [Nocardia abscessus]MCC3333575.1 hypothetical protein [Nocardia abscessus]